MLRKYIALFLVMIVFTGTALAQDAHLDFELKVQKPENEKTLTGSIATREQDILVFSSLFPSYVVSVPGKMNFENLFRLFGNDFSISVPKISDIDIESGIMTKGIQTAGLYSGDLFDEAKTVQTGTIAVSEILAYMESLPGYEETRSVQAIINGFLPGKDYDGLRNALIQYNLYDSGKYLTLNIFHGDATVATVSFDFSVQKRIEMLLGYAEEGKNYYLDAEVKETEENTVEIKSVLFADAWKNGYRDVRNSTPVLESTWTLSLLPKLREVLISGHFVPSNGLESIVFSGVMSANENPALTMEFHFSGAEDNRFIIGIQAADNVINAEEKTEVTLAEITTAQGVTPFTDEISYNFLAFYSMLLQSIPAGYQQLLVMLN